MARSHEPTYGVQKRRAIRVAFVLPFKAHALVVVDRYFFVNLLLHQHVHYRPFDSAKELTGFRFDFRRDYVTVVVQYVTVALQRLARVLFRRATDFRITLQRYRNELLYALRFVSVTIHLSGYVRKQFLKGRMSELITNDRGGGFLFIFFTRDENRLTRRY